MKHGSDADPENMNSTMTPEDYADALNRIQAQTQVALELIGKPDGIRFTSARELNTLAGGRRKRQGYGSNLHTRDVFDLLDLNAETIYSRHGNHSLTANPDTPAVPGAMQRDVFNRLTGRDILAVVNPSSNLGKALLVGQAQLLDIDADIDITDAQPTTHTRICNALDVREVVQWVVECR